MITQNSPAFDRGAFNRRVKNVEGHLKKALKKHETLTHCFNALSAEKINDQKLNDVVNKITRLSGGNSETCFESYEAKQAERLVENAYQLRCKLDSLAEGYRFDALSIALLQIKKFHLESEVLKVQLARAFFDSVYKKAYFDTMKVIHHDNLGYLKGETKNFMGQNVSTDGARQFIDMARPF
jgi:hypothetical protein